MKRWTSAALTMATVMALGPFDAVAQPMRGGRGGGPGMRANGVEAIMRMRERLELSEDQLGQLDALRREALERRSSERAEMEELMSRLRAGDIERSELRERMQGRRAQLEEAREAQRQLIEGILTDEQRATLERTRERVRAFQRGRDSATRERAGVRGGRGMRGARDLRGPARGSMRALRGGSMQRGIRGGRGFGNVRPGFRGRGGAFRRGGGPLGESD